MKVFKFDPTLVLEKTQLFPDYICLDPMVAYHGTSSVFEDQIDSEGLRRTASLVTKEEITQLTSIFEDMQWCGISGGGYPVLKPFSLDFDFRRGHQKPVFLAESSYRALLYACYDWCGGETARAVRYCLADLRRYLASAEVRDEHLETLWYEYNELEKCHALLPARPRPVNLLWLKREMERLSRLAERVDSVVSRHTHGVVYAVKFSEAEAALILNSGSMGIEVNSISSRQLISKVRVAADWRYKYMEDPHHTRAILQGRLIRHRPQAISE